MKDFILFLILGLIVACKVLIFCAVMIGVGVAAGAVKIKHGVDIISLKYEQHEAAVKICIVILALAFLIVYFSTKPAF